ncbi:phytanoyl-CoA dioxygenase family protein [Phytohabitans rumicis]|uniref:Protein involved in biosynthesis of mitomycin antibiotics/polyketide fumonisin n=1 Tax=Phytohabitans rumicis TaxID=1076125 RepID=A0A6V8KRG1_9ACTN|nr:phytanoyl-CoA dioxygenase family protein [Phytohabitans rumicis]GFJ86434.1 protein involved in biosynthesis of mitomycin antibiotics/polyketide fumonisin [Phytohabitans rumicis]
MDFTLSQYEKDGYAVVPEALTPQEVDELRAETLRICRGELGQVDGLMPPRPGDTDDTLVRRYVCVHYPHKLSPLMAGALAHPSIVDALTQVVGPDVKAMQSMLFTKGEGKPGQAWHQDEMFIPTRDRSLTAAWIALDDATVENGCLWVLPGSHRSGIIYPDREQHDDRFDCAVEAYAFPWRDEDAVPLELPAGSAVLFNGHLLHRSLPNTGKHGLRRALVNHYMSATSRLPWVKAPEGVSFAKWDYRDIVMVAGTDPYAYLGLADLARPHVRPERDGGCVR